MTVRFHLPEHPEHYEEHLLHVLLNAALPQAKAKLETLLREEAARTEHRGA